MQAARRIRRGLSRKVAARVATSCLDDKGSPSKTRVSFFELIILIIGQMTLRVYLGGFLPMVLTNLTRLYMGKNGSTGS